MFWEGWISGSLRRRSQKPEMRYLGYGANSDAGSYLASAFWLPASGFRLPASGFCGSSIRYSHVKDHLLLREPHLRQGRILVRLRAVAQGADHRGGEASFGEAEDLIIL